MMHVFPQRFLLSFFVFVVKVEMITILFHSAGTCKMCEPRATYLYYYFDIRHARNET